MNNEQLTIQSATVNREGREATFVLEVADLVIDEIKNEADSLYPAMDYKDAELRAAFRTGAVWMLVKQQACNAELESDNARLRNVIIEANRKETQY